MKKLIINSPKYGKFIALYDDEDHDLVSKYKWKIAILNKRFHYCSNSDGQLMHRIIMGNPKSPIDHINHNGLDNRRINLRIASYSQNAMNRRTPPNNTSGYKGVHFAKRQKRYQVYITVDRKKKHIGFFKDSISAAKAYNEVAKKYYGEYAQLNQIP